MLDKPNIWNEFNKSFKAPGSDRGYKPSAFFKSMISGFYMEADCISDLENIRKDDTVKDIRDTEVLHYGGINIFPNTRADTETIRATHKIMADSAVKAVKKKGLREVAADATFTKPYKQGVSEYCYKNYKASEPLFAFTARTDSIIYSEFGNGNVSPASGLYEQLVHIREELRKHGIKIKCYRSDAAGYQTDAINYRIANGMTFYARAT